MNGKEKTSETCKVQKKDPQSIPPLYCRCIQVTVGHTWGKQPGLRLEASKWLVSTSLLDLTLQNRCQMTWVAAKTSPGALGRICLGIHRKSHHPVLRTPWEKKHLPKSHQIPNIQISMKSAILCHKLPQNEPDKFLAKFPMARGPQGRLHLALSRGHRQHTWRTSTSFNGWIGDSMISMELVFKKKSEILNH